MHREDLNTLKATKQIPVCDDAMLDSSWWGLDAAVLHGSQPIASIYSRKSEDDAFPVLEERLAFRDGEEVARVAFPACPQAGGDFRSRISLAKEASYSVLKPHTANYSSRFCDSCVAPAGKGKVSESRTLTKRHPTTSQGGHGGPPFDGTQLPSWLAPRSHGPTAQTHHVNASLPCLPHISTRLQEALGDKEVTVVRVMHAYCPYMLARCHPVLHVHHNNGTLAAVCPATPGVVYCKCLHCALPGQLFEEVQVLLHGWVRLTEDEMARLTHAAAARPSGTNCAVVPVVVVPYSVPIVVVCIAVPIGVVCIAVPIVVLCIAVPIVVVCIAVPIGVVCIAVPIVVVCIAVPIVVVCIAVPIVVVRIAVPIVVVRIAVPIVVVCIAVPIVVVCIAVPLWW